jgi:solute:Na+ symporter, SSS family
MIKSSIHIIDYIIILASLIVPFAISLKFAGKQKDTKNYFTAKGSLPAWAIGMSILATLISSITFLAYPGEGFKSNWILLVQGLMVPITLVFFIGFIVPLYRNVIKLSAYEYFEKRFGFFARLYSSIGFILAHFSKMGTVFYLLALAFSSMTGFSTIYTIWILGFIVIFITLLGGIESIIWLDVFQGSLLIIGGLVALITIIFTTPGGVSAIWTVAAANHRVGFGPFDASFVKLTFWVMMFNGIFYAIQKYGTDQTIVQRYLTAKTNKDAVKASLIGVGLTVPVWFLFMFIGTALFAYYQIHSGILPDMPSDKVFPYFITSQMPVGVVGLILAALLATAISSLNADLNCLSAVCVGDYYNRISPNSSEKRRMMVSRIIIVLAGIGAVRIAQYYLSVKGEGALGIVFTLYSIFSGGIAGMFLLGIFCPRVNKQGLYIGIIAGILFTAWALLTSTKFEIGGVKTILVDMGAFNYTHNKMMLGVYSHVVVFIVGFFASYMFKKNNDIDHLTWSGWKKNLVQNEN